MDVRQWILLRTRQLSRYSRAIYNVLLGTAAPTGRDLSSDLLITPLTAMRLRNAKSWRRAEDSKGLISGWRGTVVMNIVLVLIVMILNIAFLAWALRKARIENGQGILLEADCDKTNKLETYAHLVINVLGTLLLGGSNYTMQVLLAPTREEVDAAHKKRRFLQIGTHHPGNLNHISTSRCFLWFCLAISSIPLHLLYNSAIFSSHGTNEYIVSVVSNEFFTDSAINITEGIPRDIQETLPILKDKAVRNELTYLENRQCIDAYGTQYQSRYRNLLLIADDLPVSDTSLFWSYRARPTVKNSYCWIRLGLPGLECLGNLNGSICSQRELQRIHEASWHVGQNTTDSEICRRGSLDDINAESGPQYNIPVGDGYSGFNILGCWAEKAPSYLCRVTVNFWLLEVVIASNAMKLILMVIAVSKFNQPTLVTLGDAVASFLERPDHQFSGRCLATHYDLRWWFLYDRSNRYELRQPTSWIYNPKFFTLRWFSAPSYSQWYLGLFLPISLVITSIPLLSSTITNLELSWREIWDLGFASITPQCLVNITSRHNIIVPVILANLPQLGLSIVYLQLNQLLSAMASSCEWASYACQRKGLRVTRARGQQRSTYFLQLPYVFSLPLLFLSALLHYFVSQSLFAVDILVYSSTGVFQDDLSGLGWSPIPGISTICIGFIILSGVIGLSFKKNTTLIPPARSSSLSIAAACQPLRPDEGDSTKPVQWGEVFREEQSEGSTKHCSFSSVKVSLPREGERYA